MGNDTDASGTSAATTAGRLPEYPGLDCLAHNAAIWLENATAPLEYGVLVGMLLVCVTLSLTRFDNTTIRSTSEAAGDAIQVQSADEKDQTDHIRHH